MMTKNPKTKSTRPPRSPSIGIFMAGMWGLWMTVDFQRPPSHPHERVANPGPPSDEEHEVPKASSEPKAGEGATNSDDRGSLNPSSPRQAKPGLGQIDRSENSRRVLELSDRMAEKEVDGDNRRSNPELRCELAHPIPEAGMVDAYITLKLIPNGRDWTARSDVYLDGESLLILSLPGGATKVEFKVPGYHRTVVDVEFDLENPTCAGPVELIQSAVVVGSVKGAVGGVNVRGCGDTTITDDYGQFVLSAVPEPCTVIAKEIETGRQSSPISVVPRLDTEVELFLEINGP